MLHHITMTLQQTRTFFALVRRTLHMISKQIKDTCIDGALLAALNVLLFAYLFPAMGMPSHLVIPVFIGSLLSLFVNLSFGIAVRYVFDLRFKRFIDYQLTLPMTTTWIIAAQVASFFLELLISTIPIILLSFLVLKNYISFAHTKWIFLIVFYCITLLLLSISFLASALLYPYTWFLDNMWPRRLTPLLAFGCVYVPLTKVIDISPTFARIMLLNPMTYISEGMRSSLLGMQGYLNRWMCLTVVIMTIVLAIIVLTKAVKQKLNPV